MQWTVTGPNHNHNGGEFCECGSQTVVCQGCGKVICATLSRWMRGIGNVGQCCQQKPQILADSKILGGDE